MRKQFVVVGQPLQRGISKIRSSACSGCQLRISASTNRQSGKALRASAIIAGDESMPVILAAGQRWCRRAVLLPGPQPRSAMYSIFSSGTLASSSTAGRDRSAAKCRYKEGFQSDIFYSRQRVTPIVDKTDKFASRHHPIEQTFLRGQVIKITDLR